MNSVTVQRAEGYAALISAMHLLSLRSADVVRIREIVESYLVLK